MQAIWTADEVAAAIGYRSVRTFRNNLPRLKREGFPPCLPSGCWYAPAIEQWMITRSTFTPPGPADPLAAQRAHLLQTLGG